MDSSIPHTPLRNWASLAVAVALGPAFIIVGYRIHGLVFGAATGAAIVVCSVVVPLLTMAGGRFWLPVWQVAVISMTLAVVGDNIRLNAMHRNEIASVAYVLWAGGTLLSCPLPIYLFLHELSPRQRYISCVLIAATGLVLWLGIKAITK
jgi:hypothetical protein